MKARLGKRPSACSPGRCRIATSTKSTPACSRICTPHSSPSDACLDDPTHPGVPVRVAVGCCVVCDRAAVRSADRRRVGGDHRAGVVGAELSRVRAVVVQPVLRHVRHPRVVARPRVRSTGWLVLAGLAGGVSFLFKLSGVFYLLGGGIALIATSFRRQPDGDSRRRARSGAAIVSVILILVLILLAVPISRAGCTRWSGSSCPSGC